MDQILSVPKKVRARLCEICNNPFQHIDMSMKKCGVCRITEVETNDERERRLRDQALNPTAYVKV